MIKIKRFTQGLLGSNTYVVWDEKSFEAAVIDTGNSDTAVKEIIDKIKK